MYDVYGVRVCCCVSVWCLSVLLCTGREELTWEWIDIVDLDDDVLDVCLSPNTESYICQQ